LLGLGLIVLEACGCVTHSDRLWLGHRPGDITDLNAALSPTANDKPGPLAREFGIVTTVGKRIGILGWRDMKTSVTVAGRVEQAAYSTDHFLTLDVRLREMTANGQPVALTPPRYLRAEVCVTRLGLPQAKWPKTGDSVRITGLLMWDGDGFLEVHPQRAEDVTVER